MDSTVKKERKPNPRENAFPLSVVTFSYLIPTFIKGFKRDLTEADLTETLSEHKSKALGDRLERAWMKEQERAKKKNGTPSLRRALFRVFGFEFMIYGIILAVSESIRILQPIAIGRLLDFYSPSNTEITKDDAYIYAGAVVLCSLINVLVVHPYMLGVSHLGMKLRIACCSLIYRKSLRLSNTALGETTIGQVVNLLSNDVNRFDVSLIFGHQLWVAPLETIVVSYLLYLEIGVSAFLGIVLLLVFIPMQIYIGKKVSIVRLKTALRTDERVRLMSEIINGIQVIKMYAWEKPFAKLIGAARRYEIKMLRIAGFFKGIILSFIIFNTRLSIFASIIAYVLLGNSINAEKVFVLTSFYNILRATMTVFFPTGIVMVAEANVSVNRLNKFLNYEERVPSETTKEIQRNLRDKKDVEESTETSMNGVDTSIAKKDVDIGIFMKNGWAKWSEASMDNTLSEITFSVTPGKLLAVIGPVGSGKSSLFQTILKELPLMDGSLVVNGEISYASQEPWLFSGTVRQNILFGLPMDKLRYKTVVKTCALERDFTLLPYGDKTLVGDRGVSLSGGQRARINLARAVYKEADIYLLDDPLSAVDTHVGKELFDKCINGYLRDKTVILITHQLQYLNDVNHIIYLDDGFIKAEGTFRELQNANLDFTKLLGKVEKEEDKKREKEETELKRLNSIVSRSSVEDAPAQVEEQMSKGTLGFHVYKAYLRAGGNWCVLFIVFMMFFIVQGLASVSDYFLTFWVNLEDRNFTEVESMLESSTMGLFQNLNSTMSPITEDDDFWDFTRNTCIIVYSVIMGSLVVLTLIRSFSFFVICMRASTRLHDNMFGSISIATMNFFNNNPAGRILNRFSKDMGAVDEQLPGAMIDCLQIGLTLVGIIVVIGAVSPILLAPTAVMALIFYLLRSFYLSTSRNVKRLEGVTRSPVFSHINATLNGLTTIRAFEAQDILTKEFDNHQDLHSSAWFSFIATSRAFGYWLDLICIIYIILVTFSFLVIDDDHFGGNVGLVITQAIGITGMLQWGMRQSTELENQMTSVERVVEYSSIEHERALDTIESKKPKPSWPELGKIVFKNLFLRYAPTDPPVLKHLNFTILPKEKVGIVGRTGAGKSSLINALFQLSITEGQIIIDDIDITQLGLHDLRSKISIIPQEPVLFSGSLRKNLDPFDEYSDADLWKALEEVELKEAVNDLTSGLNSMVSEGGSNFSIGQRQLVCLARAILRNNRILVLDEATANVDPQTDGLIQTTIRKKFAECTVLTIAHRLHTVMDSDKVLVMDAGTVKEFDHPHILLQNKEGIFSGMVEQTGKATAEVLHEVAKNHYESIN
ncbi:probable multidrug resistance-associated protein lethal(2)03659 isoform X2 [Coccinella septempunctata]|uniref:probable multidrug resistance-associated protein lethal(2)03659 isoform X2 n=1 Tax=Coccinella septempunctata TaxID=41139 RepID=UPI001D088CA4|nr:probable multidrug resistance-associated protein lethal(2)03659 isoform X2 [Coccinella septempunctata]